MNRWASAIRSSLRVGAVIGLVTSVFSTSAGAGDAAAPGPYKVGATFLLELDPSRSHQNGSARPLPIMVFYPADSDDVAGANAARYPRNPFVNATTQVFLSTNFEAHDIDAAYDLVPPAEGGPFPLLALSQGARAAYWLNIGIATRVASHGFVVALIAHYGEAAYANPAPSDPLNHVAQRGLDRILDMKLAIDRLLLRGATPTDFFHGLIDGDRVAVGGHSFGGLTAIQLVAGDDLVCDTYMTPPANPPPASTCVPFDDIDERVKAIVLLDASTQNVKYHELERITVPAIGIGEDPDSITAGFAGTLPSSLNARAHHAISGQPVYRVDVMQSRHLSSFNNACQSVLVRGDIGVLTLAQVAAELVRLECNNTALTSFQTANDIVWRYTIAFLKTHLTGAHGYKEVLTPGWAVAHEPFAMFFVNERRNGQTPNTEFADDAWFHLSQPNPVMEDGPTAFEN